MAMNTNHKCIICGKDYYHCNNCNSMTTFSPWRSVACSIECYQAYLTLREYQNGRMTKEEAKNAIDIAGFDMDNALDEIKPIFMEILRDESKEGNKSVSRVGKLRRK